MAKLVETFNTANDSLGAKIVLQTFARETDRLIYLEAAGDTICTTPEHPFWTGRQWTPAGYLAKGDSLYLVSGKLSAVDSIARVDSSAKVYNFEVADWHNYFVGAGGVLVHNTCPDGGSFFDGTFWSKKVQGQLRHKLDKNHAFSDALIPYIEKYGKVVVKKGGDGVEREWLELPANFNGKDGVFEFIKETDGSINHRFFETRRTK